MQFTEKEKRPVFTIITVCYNSAQTIERTICSVLTQTFKDYEYWIIDGGSTDGTLDIISSYRKKFGNNFFVISEPDNGIYNAMNKGIKRAKGEIIGLLNSDDWLEPYALSCIVQSVTGKTMNTRYIYCGWVCFHYVDGSVSILKTDEKRHKRCHKVIEIGVRHPATFVGRDVYNKIGDFDEHFRIMADVDFIFRCTEAGIPFIFIDKVLTNMSDGGVSNCEKKNVKIYSTEIKLLCRKHAKKNFEYSYLVVRKMLKLYLKFVTPKNILQLYRKIR